jgi:small-conductance mechanosensitive channel
VGRELNRRVLRRFSSEGVTIPFPQLTMWMTQGEEKSRTGTESVEAEENEES